MASRVKEAKVGRTEKRTNTHHTCKYINYTEESIQYLQACIQPHHQSISCYEFLSYLTFGKLPLLLVSFTYLRFRLYARGTWFNLLLCQVLSDVSTSCVLSLFLYTQLLQFQFWLLFLCRCSMSFDPEFFLATTNLD